MGYYFYYPLENKIFVARYVDFFKTNLIKQEASGSTVDFDEIQSEDAQPSENTSLHQHEVEHDTVEPQTDVILVRRSLEAMNTKMQSMKDNQVWNLVDLPPNCKTVGSNWLFKKKTNMDVNIHTYKDRLVAKGFTQTYGADYEETFSPVADIKAIRILIAIAAYYDYEIWQMDVKTAFLNGAMAMRNTKDMFLVYGGDSTTDLGVTCYTNGCWETDRDDLRYQTGVVFMMNRGAVDWKSSKQSTTAMSSIEAEYIDAAEAAMEVIWIRKFISGLGVVPNIDKPMDMYCDNTSVITITDEPGV
ncbi:retrotransposon protein, putative, ty1-copia subclass [Tanacetum coccineum]